MLSRASATSSSKRSGVTSTIRATLPTRPGLLGLYEGVPLTKRTGYGTAYNGLPMPDRITIFRLPICRMCATEADVVQQVRVTVVHEVAHHFGIDDDRLQELGW